MPKNRGFKTSLEKFKKYENFQLSLYYRMQVINKNAIK